MNLNSTEANEATAPLQLAKMLWQESEWRLNFLRTQAGTPLQPPNDQTLLDWYQHPKTQDKPHGN